jgi:Zn-dependent metalloprotease
MNRILRRLLAAGLGIAALALLAIPVGTREIPQSSERFSALSGRSLRDWSGTVESLERSRELRLRDVQQDSILAGRRHERLDQYFRGVRVFGADVVRETDGKSVLGVMGTLQRGIRVDTTPVLTQTDALAVFDRETGGARSAPVVAPELVVLPKDDGTYVLAYRVTSYVNGRLPVVFVNARSGAVELRYDNRQKQAAAATGVGIYGDEKKMAVTLSGTTYQASDGYRPTRNITYDFKGAATRLLYVPSFAAADIATNATAAWTDPVVVDAHTYVGWTYDYFYKRFGWKGLDNRDSRPLQVVVHPVRREDLSKYLASSSWEDVVDFYLNAYFCPQCGSKLEDELMLGEGIPPQYVVSTGQWVNYFAAGIDVVSHEYSHGVTAYTSNLVYRNESGALNESFSDMMSVGVEFSFQAAGSGRLKADYLEGEDVFLPGNAGSVAGLRSLANPAAFGDPDHYSKRYTGTDDNGGVHTNSGIPNHAYYLAIEGGTNRTSGLGVHGVGADNREQIEKVFFRAFTTLPSTATFSQARARTIQSARDLYSANAAVERAVTEAWTAVGVQ